MSGVPESVESCRSRLTPDAFTRVPIYAVPELGDSVQLGFQTSIDLLTEAVAERARALLGAERGQLPAGEAALKSGGFASEPSLLVTAHRDGRLTWKPDSLNTVTARVTADAGQRMTAIQLMDRALSELYGEKYLFLWPAGTTFDAFRFRIRLIPPEVRRGGIIEPLGERIAFPVFTLAMPWSEQVQILRAPRAPYPEAARSYGASGRVVLAYVIDTVGRVEPESVRDVWPPDRARLTGDLESHYQAFVRAAREGLRAAKFAPAIIGGCPIRQLVIQPFHFNLR